MQSTQSAAAKCIYAYINKYTYIYIYLPLSLSLSLSLLLVCFGIIIGRRPKASRRNNTYPDRRVTPQRHQRALFSTALPFALSPPKSIKRIILIILLKRSGQARAFCLASPHCPFKGRSSASHVSKEPNLPMLLDSGSVQNPLWKTWSLHRGADCRASWALRKSGTWL